MRSFCGTGGHASTKAVYKLEVFARIFLLVRRTLVTEICLIYIYAAGRVVPILPPGCLRITGGGRYTAFPPLSTRSMNAGSTAYDAGPTLIRLRMERWWGPRSVSNLRPIWRRSHSLDPAFLKLEGCLPQKRRPVGPPRRKLRTYSSGWPLSYWAGLTLSPQKMTTLVIPAGVFI